MQKPLCRRQSNLLTPNSRFALGLGLGLGM